MNHLTVPIQENSIQGSLYPLPIDQLLQSVSQVLNDLLWLFS